MMDDFIAIDAIGAGVGDHSAIQMSRLRLSRLRGRGRLSSGVSDDNCHSTVRGIREEANRLLAKHLFYGFAFTVLRGLRDKAPSTNNRFSSMPGAQNRADR